MSRSRRSRKSSPRVTGKANRKLGRSLNKLPSWLLLLLLPVAIWYFLFLPFQPPVYLGVPLAVKAKDSRSLVMIDHGIFSSVMDCRARVPALVVYSLGLDQANAPRHPEYIDDLRLKLRHPDCHPFTHHSFNTYQAALRAQGVNRQMDVGHLAMANHLDYNERSMRLANQWSNLAPQSAVKNRQGGAWYSTELIAECHRDVEPILVFAGTQHYWPTRSPQPLLDSFGQLIPEYWWRLIYWPESNYYAAWWIPNQDSSSHQALLAGQFDISLAQLQQRLNHDINLLTRMAQLGARPAPVDFVRTTQSGSTLTCRGQRTDLS